MLFRNRATQLSLIVALAVAIAATAPALDRGGAASEVHTLGASEPVAYETGFDKLDAHIASANHRVEAQKIHDAQVAAYVAAVHQAELDKAAADKAAAEAARAEAARAAKRAQATPPPTTQAITAVAAVPSGSCGGWGDLIAKYFPGEEGTACRVMLCESRGNPNIHNESGSGASGLWQFMNGTWESTTNTPAPASQYSAETQTAAAAKLRHSAGWGAWSCY